MNDANATVSHIQCKAVKISNVLFVSGNISAIYEFQLKSYIKFCSHALSASREFFSLPLFCINLLLTIILVFTFLPHSLFLNTFNPFLRSHSYPSFHFSSSHHSSISSCCDSFSQSILSSQFSTFLLHLFLCYSFFFL